jgi:S-adenosylmethionine synthetase
MKMAAVPVFIGEITEASPPEPPIEIVERKGLGDPDTCDLVMEQISQKLSQARSAKFGRILHCNCDA